MATRCPNKNTQEWKELVDNLGEDTAYRAFIANNESLPDLDTVRDIISLYTEEVDTSTEISEDSIRSIEESRELLEKKKQVLKENFSNAGIDVNIREEAIDKGIAYVETKEGENPTIVLDPQKVRGDTLMHEFGHIYIDMLGYESGVIQEGIERLRNGDIWKEVERNYPDLGQEEFEKEVLATAIGREGVRTEENPSKFKVWINKLIRKISELLGISKNSARTLAEEMWKGQLRVREFQGGLSTAVQEQREEAGEEEILSDYEKKRRQDAEAAYADITSLSSQVGKVRGLLKRNVENLENRARVKGRQKELEPMKEQIDALKNVQKVGDMINFFEMAYGNVKQARSRIDKIKGKIKSTEGKIDEDDVRKAVEAFNFLKEFDVVSEFNNFIDTENMSENEKKISENINAIIKESGDVQRDFINDIIPVQADFLLEYQGEGINEELQEIIDNVEKSKERVRQGKDPKVRKLGPITGTDFYKKRKKRAKKEGWYNTKEWELEKADIFIEQIKNRHLVNRKTLINMLRSEFTKKSEYSFYADPIIYSSDQSIQMFAKAVKNELYRAANDTHETKANIQEYYEEFKRRSGRSDENTSKFNEDIIETFKMPQVDPETGETITDEQGNVKITEHLGFVQPYDVGSYYVNSKKLYLEGDKLGRPSLKDTDLETYRNWLKTEQGKKWRKLQADWLKENTQPIEDAQEELEKLRKEYREYESKIKQLDQEIDNAEQNGEQPTLLRKDRADYQSLLNELDRQINTQTMIHPETGERLFKGSLVKPSEKYKNPKYEKLMSDPNKEAAREYYKNMLEVYQNSQEKISLRQIQRNTWDRHTYMLPSIRKEDYDRLHEQGVWKSIKDWSKESFSVQRDTDVEYGASIDAQGNDIKEVPIFWTGYVEAKDVSRDVASSIIQFEHMANMYKRRSQIQGRAMLMKEIIDRRQKLETDSKGELSLDSILKKLGVRQPIEERGTDWHSEQLRQFIDNTLFDEKMIKSEFHGIELTKASGTLANITAKNTLGFNVLQAINNTLIGRVFGWAEAAGGNLYSGKNFWKAGNVILEQQAAVQDIGKIKNKTKLGQLNELYDPVQGEVINMSGKKETGSVTKKVLGNDPLMFMQQGGEFEMHNRTMVAAMLEMTVKDKDGNPVKNDKGNNMSLWEAYYVDTKDGKLKLDERVHFTEKNRMNLMNRIHGVNKKLHGAYSDFDKGMLKRRAIGQLLFLFRGWFPPGIRKRYGHGHGLHVDHESGEVSEGIYQSFWRLIRESWQNKKWAYNDMTNMEKANVRRMAIEQLFVIGMFGLIYGLSEGDDEENNYLENMVLYQAARTRAETMFYYNPVDFYRIFKSPTATTRTIDNASSLTFQIMQDVPRLATLQGWERYERRVGQYPKGTPKIKKDFHDVLPVAGQIRKDPEKAAQWFFIK